MNSTFLNKHKGFILILILGCIPLLDFFHPGLPITHDGQDHVARIANFYQNLTEGNVIPRWAGNLNWGYGHPILMFLYPLPSYLASLFHFVGFSLVDSVKLVFVVTYILSGVCMYLWGRNALGENAGIVSGALYMYAPYRFVDLYVRGAIGEHVAFLFGPIILYGLLKLSESREELPLKKVVFLSLSVAGLLLSHNAVALMFIPIFLVYSLYLIYNSNNKKKLALYYLFSGILGFGISAFFIIPAFFEGKYTLRDIVTSSGEYKNGFVKLQDFILPQWSFGGSQLLSKQVGLLHLTLIILTLVFFKRLKQEKKIFLIYFSLGLILVSMFLMLPYSDFIWQRITILQKFQFPWRLLSPLVMGTSILGALSVYVIKKKKYEAGVVLLICAGLVLLNFPYFHPQGYLYKNDSFFTGIYNGTTDTGESSPRWSVRFMEHKPSSRTQFIDGGGTILEKKRTSTLREYEITSSVKVARVLENTLYFPDWVVYVNNKKVPVEYQDRMYRGLITYYIEQGNSNIRIVFNNTRMRNFSNLISVFSFICMGALLCASFIRVKKHD